MNKKIEINKAVDMMCEYLVFLNPTKQWKIVYDENVDTHRFTNFEEEYFGILDGEEFFFVYDDVKLLYAVNVTGDSTLTAVSELINLLARKF